MNAIEKVVRKFGGTRRMARMTKFGISQIQHWKKRGQVPAMHQYALLAEAARLGVQLAPAELIAPPPAGE